MKSNLFWGKSRPLEDGTLTHPLVCHCLDVAAVADTLLKQFPRRLSWLSRLLGAEPVFLRNFIVRLIAFHDLGKFHPDFQGKLDGYCAQHLPALAPLSKGYGERHDLLGMLIAGELGLFERFKPVLPGWRGSDFGAVFSAVAFHHGVPGECNTNSPWGRACSVIEPAIDEFAGQVFEIVPCDGTLPAPPGESLRIFSWALAGLTVLADWIGSNGEVFEFSAPPEDLGGYWRKARIKAECAVRKAGILPVRAQTLANPAALLPLTGGGGAAPEASPLQTMAFELPLGVPGPRLFMIEDVTGAGKTEAALILASRLLSEEAASGLYFALPTMATANAMYERMGGVYRKLFAGEPLPSLVLAHGRRRLHEGFTSSILENTLSSQCAKGEDGAEPSELACAAWIADDRRKSFFAHVGVGTIDQALLGVLPSRHQALRLWGLADRVLIADEAHCYDAYVNKELERLIEFHTALGGSTIVLSATLAASTRRSLLSAFCKGARLPEKKPSSAAYPLATAISGETFEERGARTRAELRRRLPLRRIESLDAALGAVTAAAGACAPVAWIRNAVDDAIEACQALETQGFHPLLLHARFAMGDRMDKEREIASKLGRGSTSASRRGLIVVGTQILEQSLDYDVDAMVTDLAPIDLIIQRAGRLWRHPWRKDRFLTAPELLIFSPDPDQAQNENWYGAMSPRAAAVYRDHRIIWLTAKALFAAGEIQTPDRLRDLISQVYDTDEAAPAAIETKSREAEGKAYAVRAIAEGCLLDLSSGYGGNNRIWQDDRKVFTRLEEQPSTIFRLGREEAGKIVPWYDGGQGCEENLRRAWALSEVSIQQGRARGVPKISGARAKLIEAAKSSWGQWERDIPLLLLEPDGMSWSGSVVAGEAERVAHYDTGLGFRIAG